ncbi:MAG: hypothetical protein PHS14_07990 [Elusimicrobia bacterium]|nr:hypothetical protein [Elusimicrobiota bacterium]
MVDHVSLPVSASDEAPAPSAPESAYLHNPIADKAMLTPAEALKAIALLATTLECDERYRAQLAARTVPDGD